jgi:adenosine kinase
MSGDEIADGLKGAFMVICNDYEFELIRQKTGKTEADILAGCELLVVTKGEHGSSILRSGRGPAGDGQRSQIDVPAVTPHKIADPTGVGDAFRGGFMKGLSVGATDEVCGRLGSVAATYALEHLGGTAHSYSWQEFVERYEAHFGKLGL